jgi:23S rRNA (adenine2503-C2)-methyltransferase
MRFSVAFSLLLSSSHAYMAPHYTPKVSVAVGSTLAPAAPTLSAIVSPTKVEISAVGSTLLPEVPTQRANGDDSPNYGGISMPLDELAEVLGGKGRAQIVWDCYSIGIDPAHFFGSVINLGYDDYESIYAMLPSARRSQRLGSDALNKLASLYSNNGGKVEGGVAKLSYISRSTDDTTKLLLKLSDGLEVETVIIPWKGERSTLCISSQVGCRQGCTFCATGRMGKIRDLTSDEILAQMFFAKKICRLNGLPEISNIVFMGMGEPADNSENVVKAVEILTKNELFQLSASKVTVSTVAPTPDAFKDFAKAPCVMAWSVHAANDALRKKLVPTSKHSMAELRQGFIDALLERPQRQRTAMLEVALMKGVNDSLKEADEMAEFAQVISDSVPGSKLMINLIPFNDIGQTLYQKPTNNDVVAFQKRLQSHGLYSHIRATRGDDATAACGQLATKKSGLKKP